MSKAVQQELGIFAVTHAAASMTARGRAAASSAALSLGEIIISRLSSSKWSLSGVGGQRETPATADAADVQSSV
eukprot:1968947-Prymnesium_polylepis.1